MTKEEKEKKIQEEKAKNREAALENLGGSLWNYAAPKLITAEQYGGLSQASERFYFETISKAPEQNVYEQLFLPQLAGEGGAITSPYLQTRSLAILQESLFGVKVEDAVKYAGVEKVGEKFKDKYVSDLSQEEAGQIVGSAIQYQTDNKVKDILALRQKGISEGLEKILSEPEKKEEKKE